MNKEEEKNQKLIDACDYLSSAASSQDLTGLIPSAPVSPGELESYEELYPFLPPGGNAQSIRPEKNGSEAHANRATHKRKKAAYTNQKRSFYHASYESYSGKRDHCKHHTFWRRLLRATGQHPHHGRNQQFHRRTGNLCAKQCTPAPGDERHCPVRRRTGRPAHLPAPVPRRLYRPAKSRRKSIRRLF